MNTKRGSIFHEINNERSLQDAQWGGPSHDDQHTANDFLCYIEKQIDNARFYAATPQEDTRSRFVKIAALSVAALESIDRRSAPKTPRVIGVSRDAESPGERSILVSFDRKLTDDEMRALQEAIKANMGKYHG